jgi:hypothetical protein
MGSNMDIKFYGVFVLEKIMLDFWGVLNVKKLILNNCGVKKF